MNTDVVCLQIYLKVARGGGTDFPKANGGVPGDADFYSRVGAVLAPTGGVTVMPTQGKAILFYNLLPNG